jgi:hypothetical protein
MHRNPANVILLESITVNTVTFNHYENCVCDYKTRLFTVPAVGLKNVPSYLTQYGALDLTTSTSTRFNRVRGNHRSRSRFRSDVAFIAANQQREKKFHKLNLLAAD